MPLFQAEVKQLESIVASRIQELAKTRDDCLQFTQRLEKTRSLVKQTLEDAPEVPEEANKRAFDPSHVSAVTKEKGIQLFFFIIIFLIDAMVAPSITACQNH